MKKTKDELEEQLCNYCKATPGVFGTSNGYTSCEGSWCDEAYENYLEDEDDEDDDDDFGHMHEVEKCYGYDGEYQQTEGISNEQNSQS